MLRDYLAYRIVSSPLEPVARFPRRMRQRWKRWLHPEFDAIYREDDRIHEILRQVITPSANCIDIGAHLGSVLARLARLSPNGRHIAIEPTPRKARWLRRKFPDVEVLELALCDRSGESVFFHNSKRSGYSGLSAGTRRHDRIQKLRVRTAQLDTLVPPGQRVDFIKIDVEGAELLVLRGAERVLTASRPMLLFECSREGLATFGFSPLDIYDFLVSRHGYSIFLPADWIADRPAVSFPGFNRAMTYPFQAFNFVAFPATRGDETAPSGEHSPSSSLLQ